MGAASADVPAIQLVTGPMMTGRLKGERLGACERRPQERLACDVGHVPVGLDRVAPGVDPEHTRLAGGHWTVTASHELLEMLGDPDINLTVFVQNGEHRTGRLYAYEVCDACEDDAFGYVIDQVLVSDFVYPSWFESFRKKGSTRFDYGQRIHHPFELLSGGYIGYFDVTGGHGWQQLTKDGRAGARSRPRVGSRRERRRTPRDQWQESAVVPLVERAVAV